MIENKLGGILYFGKVIKDVTIKFKDHCLFPLEYPFKSIPKSHFLKRCIIKTLGVSSSNAEE